ncbi:MAG: NAD(P)/FAD-dependent oxidoreductase [Myxococcota bacterium]|nr:NAD(P)/FAD-dependent oxidoreductase [Myxococcota bacterium]
MSLPDPNPTDTDVAIVGGGPAGLACAIHLGLQGIRTTVLEARDWPVDKVCGEGLMPTGVDALRRMGALRYVPSDAVRPFRGISWHGESSVIASADFAHGSGLGIRRTGLSQALVHRCNTLPSVRLQSGTKVQTVHASPTRMTLTVIDAGRQSSLTAKLVIAADGRNSVVKRSLGHRGPPPLPHQRWGARLHFQCAPWSDRVEVYWGPNLEAYVTPSSNHRVEIAFLWRKGKYHPRRTGPALCQGLLEEFPALMARLDGAPLDPASRPRAVGPLACSSKKAFDDRCLYVGDALGYGDGITGEGLSVAFAQAEAIGARLPGLLDLNKCSASDLATLGGEVHDIFKESLPLIKAALLLSDHPRLRRLALRGMSRSPRIFQHFLEANMGRRRLWALPASGLPAFLIGLAKPAEPRALTIDPTMP